MRTPARFKGRGSLAAPLLRKDGRDSDRCNRRVESMIEHGALDEVQALLRRNLDPTLPAIKAVGVRELSAHLSDSVSLDEAIAATQQATRNYAKRQMTWFRNQTADWARAS